MSAEEDFWERADRNAYNVLGSRKKKGELGELERRLNERRKDKKFMDRIKASVKRNAEILRRLAQ